MANQRRHAPTTNQMFLKFMRVFRIFKIYRGPRPSGGQRPYSWSTSAVVLSDLEDAFAALDQISLADLRMRERRSPWWSKFFQFHAVLGKIWQNYMLAPPPPEGWRPNLGEILDPPLNMFSFQAMLWKHLMKNCFPSPVQWETILDPLLITNGFFFCCSGFGFFFFAVASTIPELLKTAINL